jgi:hypothetical protein
VDNSKSGASDSVSKGWDDEDVFAEYALFIYFSIVVVVDISSSSTPTPSPKKASASVDSDGWSSFEEADNLAKANAKKK